MNCTNATKHLSKSYIQVLSTKFAPPDPPFLGNCESFPDLHPMVGYEAALCTRCSKLRLTAPFTNERGGKNRFCLSFFQKRKHSPFLHQKRS
jgi:hypothetical protein